jgi:hypothetical protein
MAVNIDVPGVGRIQVEGVASEAVMEKILAQLKAMDPKAGGGPAAKAQADAAKAAGDLANQTKELTKAEDAAEEASKRREKARHDAGVQMGRDITAFTASMASNATRLAISLGKMHDQVAADPIGTGASLLNVGIDVLNQGTKIASKGLQGLGEGIPFVGGVIKGLGAAAEAAADALANAAKIANAFLSAELKKTTEAMKTFAAAGAGFAGGLTELRMVAGASGLNLKSFSEVIKNSRENITGMGLSATEAAVELGAGMNRTMTQVGRSGQTLRNEMLNMGYSYEQQGVIMSQYMANMRATGALEKMSKEELAKGTRDYARDLKVLADITGKDAAKAMEQARMKSMEADIMAQLSPEEAEKFQKAYASMPEYAKKGFMEYVSTGGTAITDQATNIAMSQNAQLGELFKQGYNNIKDSAKDSTAVQRATLEQAARVSEEQVRLSKEGNAQIGMAARLGATQLQGVADMQNQMITSALYGVDTVGKSIKVNETQAVTADKASQGFANATDAAMKFSIQMETLATQMMPKYSELLGDAMMGMINVMRKLGADIPETQLEMERRLAGEAERAASSQADQERRAGSSMAMEGFELPQFAGGGIADGPDSGHLAMLHGKEAVIPLKDEKVPIQFEPDWYDKLARAAQMVTSSTRNAMADGVNIGGGFGEAQLKLVEMATTKVKELEQTDSGRVQLADMMKNFTDTLAQLKEGRSRVESGGVSLAGEGKTDLIEAQNRMIGLFEQFITKQDELKREMERSREAQEMMRDLL